MLHIEPTWNEVLGKMGDPGRTDIVYVVGGVDTGKTTLCGFLTRRLAALGPAALLDGDPGQSAVGPPATLGVQLPDGSVCLNFVGATSPRGHLPRTVTGIKHLTQRALDRGARKVVLDSCGLVSGAQAAALHLGVLELVRPTHIIALQRGRELEGLLAGFRGAAPIHRLGVSPAVSQRTPRQRRAYRRERFRQYLQAACTQDLDLAGLSRHGGLPAELTAAKDLHRLVALSDPDGCVLVLGIIEGVDRELGHMALTAPPFDAGRVAAIQCGALRLDRSGREIGRRCHET